MWQKFRDNGGGEEQEDVDDISFHLRASFNRDAVNDGVVIQVKRVEAMADKRGGGDVIQRGQ